MHAISARTWMPSGSSHVTGKFVRMPSTKKQDGPPIKEAVMARKRFQSGMLTKEGKRRKVWVLRWRESVLGDAGVVQRVRRSEVIGTVAELPTRRDAQNRVEERLRAINAGTGKPES